MLKTIVEIITMVMALNFTMYCQGHHSLDVERIGFYNQDL